jgi:hypothetical protein
MINGSTTFGGPVSAALEADLRTWVRRQGVVVWLDQAGHYTGFVDRLVAARKEGNLPYEVRAYRGSHLALMLALDGLAAGTEKVPLVIHMPGFTEDSVRNTPIFELYSAGVRYRKALDTAVTEAAAGRVRPDAIAAFRVSGSSLDEADAWLAGLLQDMDDVEGGFGSQLRAMKPAAMFDDLLGSGLVSARITASEADANALWDRLFAWFGLPVAWRETALPASSSRPEDLAFAAASWALCVEYVDDLKRPPVSEHLTGIGGLPRGVIDACRAVATHLRARHTAFYQRTADETEELLADEVEAAKAEDLGKVDTFRFEEEKVLKAGLEALESGAWDLAAEWVALRLGGKTASACFWLRDDPNRQSVWQLVGDAARLGQAVARAGRLGACDGGVGDAVETYVTRGAAVDQAHRHLEQRRAALLHPQVPEFEALRARLDSMRGVWRAWADGWAREFNAVCRTHGFMPAPSLQQRTLFDEVVKPMTQEHGVTAYFVVDALRFEMGEELFRQLEGTAASTVQLKARLAELPTVTEVGMNVLAPVEKKGRLTPVLASPEGGVLGFQAGEFRVSDPETRKRAMHDRAGGSKCPWFSLEEVVGREITSLKQGLGQARLVVVHSQEIDNAGEKGVGPSVFDTVMQKLRGAWQLLREAGVRRFVFTSDHGFLLLDAATGGAQAHGRKVDPKRRHVFSQVAADHSGEVRVALSDLGWEGVTGHLMFPETTAVFDTGRRPMSFVHGGNSLAERVIPVLTVVHRAAAGATTQQYAVSAQAREDFMGLHCVEVKVEVMAQTSLDFGSPQEVELAVRVSEEDGGEALRVELAQVRGKAQLVRGGVVATVGESFEVFFRIAGDADARVRIELHHPSKTAEVKACVVDARFPVSAVRVAPPAAPKAPPRQDQWLEGFEDAREREVFAHLATHGVITEAELGQKLGGARELRAFSRRVDELAKKAPFGVRIEAVGNVKRYVKD